MIQRTSLPCLDGKLFSPFSLKTTTTTNKRLKRRKGGIFRKMKRKSVSRTNFFWYNISVFATDARKYYFPSFPSPLYFSVSQLFLEMLVFVSWIQVCPLPAGYVKASGWNGETSFSWKPGDCLSIWGRDYSGDSHSISGICWKGNPHCGGRCHSHANPICLSGSTF